MIVRLHTRRQRCRFLRRHPEAIHAGIDVKRRAAVPRPPGHKRIPFGKFSHRVDDRSRRKFDKTVGGLQGEAVQDINRRVFRPRAHDAGFGAIGDKKRLAAGLSQRRNHRLEPEAIGVGFDDRRAFDGEQLARQRLPIRGDGSKVDSERGADFGGGRRGFGRRGAFGACHEHFMAADIAAVKLGASASFRNPAGARYPDWRNASPPRRTAIRRSPSGRGVACR